MLDHRQISILSEMSSLSRTNSWVGGSLEIESSNVGLWEWMRISVNGGRVLIWETRKVLETDDGMADKCENAPWSTRNWAPWWLLLGSVVYIFVYHLVLGG